jgi:hypothetical protein
MKGQPSMGTSAESTTELDAAKQGSTHPPAQGLRQRKQPTKTNGEQAEVTKELKQEDKGAAKHMGESSTGVRYTLIEPADCSDTERDSVLLESGDGDLEALGEEPRASPSVASSLSESWQYLPRCASKPFPLLNYAALALSCSGFVFLQFVFFFFF